MRGGNKMKRLLLGLVITLTMTGSGYTKEMDFENCDLLRNLAIMNVDNARQRFLRIGSDIASGEMKMADKDALDKNTCISYTPDEGVGIWDTPCKYNEDCPFFKKNRNYPNSRGGCIDGFCEMPTNIKTLGYKEYNEAGTNAAICYNCDKYTKENGEICKGIECNQCCKLQEKKELYPNLKSPDYSFPNDYFERIKYAEELKKLNLAPVKITI